MFSPFPSAGDFNALGLGLAPWGGDESCPGWQAEPAPAAAAVDARPRGYLQPAADGVGPTFSSGALDLEASVSPGLYSGALDFFLGLSGQAVLPWEPPGNVR
eukprot:3194809-Pyramimonas_sp.AAC.1